MRTRRMIIPEKLGMISHPKYDWSLVTSDKWLILIQSKDTVLFFLLENHSKLVEHPYYSP
jgi:hypothetical protein